MQIKDGRLSPCPPSSGKNTPCENQPAMTAHTKTKTNASNGPTSGGSERHTPAKEPDAGHKQQQHQQQPASNSYSEHAQGAGMTSLPPRGRGWRRPHRQHNNAFDGSNTSRASIKKAARRPTTDTLHICGVRINEIVLIFKRK